MHSKKKRKQLQVKDNICTITKSQNEERVLNEKTGEKKTEKKNASTKVENTVTIFLLLCVFLLTNVMFLHEKGLRLYA